MDQTTSQEIPVTKPEENKKKRGDSARLAHWRSFATDFKNAYPKECSGKSASWVAKQAGYAWRHNRTKKRVGDPETVDLPFPKQ